MTQIAIAVVLASLIFSASYEHAHNKPYSKEVSRIIAFLFCAGVATIIGFGIWK